MLAWLAVQQRALALGWALLPLVVFVVLLVVHERVLARRRRAERARRVLRELGLARLDGDHSGGTAGDRYLEDGHLFAVDLDLFGQGSVFQLLSRARTLWGEESAGALAPGAVSRRRRDR